MKQPLYFSKDTSKTFLGSAPKNMKEDWERTDLDNALRKAEGLATVKNKDKLHVMSDLIHDKSNRVYLKNFLPIKAKKKGKLQVGAKS